jgi:hypothetical protein
MPKKIAILCLLIALLTSTTFNISSVGSYGETGTEIAVINPLTGDGNFIYSTENGTVGTRFNATAWIYNVSDLFAWQVKLDVDDTLLNITGAWLPTWDPNYVFAGQTTIRPAPAYYDNDGDGITESVLVGDSLLTGTPFTGDGLLAIIELEIIYTPASGTVSSNLNIDNTDTYALNSELNRISIIKTNGYYEYIGLIGPPPPHVYVFPEETIDPTLVPSSNFKINISILNAEGVYGFEFKLGFDPNVLNVENAALGDFFPQSVTPQITIDNTAGYIHFYAELSPPELPKSGNGTLAIITFHVENTGATDLTLYDTGLWDENMNPLTHTTADGFFSNVLLARLYIKPPELISPELLPGATLTVDVVVDDVENMYGYEFKLSYNTEMLTCIGIYIHPVLNETHFTTSMQMDDSAGLIWIKVDYYSPATPITTYTPVSLVTLTFMVDNVGSSILDLHNTSITDPDEQPISHEATDGYVQTLIHDVAITNVTSSHTWAYIGWIVNITVTAKNLGNASESFDVTAYYGDNIIGTITVTDLPPNEETELIFIWNTTGVEEGIYIISAEASPVPYEFNTADNYYEDGTIEILRIIRDVAIIDVYPDVNAAYPGWIVNITVIVKNEGNVSESFDVTAYYNNTSIATQTVVDLPPGEEATLTFLWDTSGLEPCNNYTISTEASPVPYEFDLTNNYLADGYVKIKIWGDVNGDGKVDILDIAIIATAFGSYPGHERWNPDADINRDQKVDILDLAIAAANYGESC